MDIQLRKQRGPEQYLSENAGKTFSPPTPLYDATCCGEDPDNGRNGHMWGLPPTPLFDPQRQEHARRFMKQTLVHQGSSTYSRVDGDFDYVGGVPDRLMNNGTASERSS